jgi:protease IV
MNFFKTFFASCLGTLLALVALSILSFFLIIGLISSASSDQKVVVKDNSVLHLKLDVPITEQETENPFDGLPIPGAEEAGMGLLNFKSVIKSAQDDPKIKGIYLDVTFFLAGYASAEEIRQSLLDFRESGKWVVAYSEIFTEPAYYIASAADKIYLNPEGELEFNGLTANVTFFKKMFDKLDIEPEIFRVGEFKSAVEPFLLDKMSDANRLQLQEWINTIHGNVVSKISETRNISKDRIKEIADKMLVRSTQDAVDLGLVDSLMYYDQVLADLRGRLSLKEKDKINFIKYSKYKKNAPSPGASTNEIAVIVADGDIVSGKAQPGVIGSDTFAEQIRKARLDDRVKAIVIRVNSPGGSALASDVMWREIQLAKEVKPVIASMSDYAASGGYYLAMGCDTIVAQPNTITGSIGVFSMLFDVSKFMDNKLGITFDEVKTGEIGDLSFTRPLSDAEKAIFQKKTDEIYETFTSKAAQGRGVSQDQIKKVASGRVWTGIQAKERGLVDVLGSYDDAIKIAAKAAGIDGYKTRLYPKQKNFWAEWMDSLEEVQARQVKSELGIYYPVYLQLKKLETFYGAQARMPYQVVIQ